MHQQSNTTANLKNLQSQIENFKNNGPLQLTDILKGLNQSTDVEIFPALMFQLKETTIDTEKQSFEAHCILEKNGVSQELELAIQLLPSGLEIFTNYQSKSGLSLGEIVGEIWPDSFQKLLNNEPGTEAKIISNLKSSYLNQFQLSFNTHELTFSLLAHGEVMGIKGTLSVTIDKLDEERFFSFNFYGDTEANLKSIPELLEDTLGLKVDAIKDHLPKMQMALSTLSFDQYSKQFIVGGSIAQTNGSAAYQLDSRLLVKVDQGITIDLDLDAERSPIKLADLAQDLPINLGAIKDSIPSSIVDKIGATIFHKFNAHIDTGETALSFEAVADLFGELLIHGSFNFSKSAGLSFDLTVHDDPRSLSDVLEFLGLKIEKGLLPQLKTTLKTFQFNQLNRQFLIEGAISDSQGHGTLGLEIQFDETGKAVVEVRYHASETQPLTLGGFIDNALPASLMDTLPTDVSKNNNGLLKGIKDSSLIELTLTLNTVNQKLDLEGKVDLYGSIVSVSSAIFRQNDQNYLSLSVTIDSISQKELFQKVGAAPLPNAFPELIFKDLFFSVDTWQKEITFKGQSALEAPLRIGNTDLRVHLGIDAVLDLGISKKLTGILNGDLEFANQAFSTELTLGAENQLTFKQKNTEEGPGLKGFLEELTGETITLPSEVPDLKVNEIGGNVNFTTMEAVFSGVGYFEWDLLRNGDPVKAKGTLSFGRKLYQNEGQNLYRYEGSLNVTSESSIAPSPEIKLSNYDFHLNFEDKIWSVSGGLDASVFNKTLKLEAGLVTTQEARSITLKSQASATDHLLKIGPLELNKTSLDLVILQNKDSNKSNVTGTVSAQMTLAGTQVNISALLAETLTFKSTIPSLQLQAFTQHLLGIGLPEELPDIRFENLKFNGTPTKQAFSFYGEVTTGDWQLNTGTANLSINKAVLDVQRSDGKTAFNITVSAIGQITEDIKFDSIEMTFGYDSLQGWILKGSLESNLLGETFTLSAGYQENTLTLSYQETTKTPLLQIPDIGTVDVSNVTLSLQRDQGVTNWKFASTGSLSIPNLVDFDGTLSFEKNSSGTQFCFTPEQATLTIPLFPLQDGSRLTFLFEFGPLVISRKMIDGKPQWEFSASVAFSCPQFYEILPAEIQSIFPDKITTRFIAQGKSIKIVTDKILDARVEIPPIVLEGVGEIPIGLTRFSLTNLAITFGSEIALSVDFGLGLPASLNKNFGVKDNGEPFLDLFNTFDTEDAEDTTIRLRLSAGTKSAKVMLVTSPFAFIKFEEADGKIWCYADLGDCGAVRFQIPEFQLDVKTRSFIFNGSFEVVRDLALPLHLVKLLMKGAKADDLAEILPDVLPLQEISLLDANDKLDVDEFIAIFEKILKTKVPAEFRTVLGGIEEGINRLPDGFRKYLKISIPKSFAMDISITPENQGISVKMGVKKGDPPVRMILPTSGPMGLPQFVGIELYNMTFGELYGTNFFLLELDARIDHFDLFSMAGALALGTDHTLPLPSSNDIQRRIIIEDLFTLIFAGIKVYGVPIPIPIPLFYTELGVEYCGLEGIRSEAHIGFPKPELNIMGLFKSMADLVKFVRQPEAEMNPQALGKMDVKFNVGPTFFQLPDYLGGGSIGSKTGVPLPGAYELMAKIMNAIKFFSLTETIASVPLEHRIKSEEIQFFGLGIEANWVITTLSEFRQESPDLLKQITSKGKELMALLPQQSSENASKDQEGLVVFLQGGFNIPNFAFLDSAFALAAVDGQSFATGFRLNGFLTDLFAIDLKGQISIDPQKTPVFDLKGAVNMSFLNEQVLTGMISIDDKGLTIGGQLDLFPKSSPLQINAAVKGHIRKDTFLLQGDVSVTWGGPFSIARGHINLSEQGFLITGEFLDQSVIMSLQRQENALRFFATMTPLSIGNLLNISGNGPAGGPILYLELGQNIYQKPEIEGSVAKILPAEQSNALLGANTHEAWVPSGDAFRFYLSANISLLGLSGAVEIAFSNQGFSAEIEGMLFEFLQCKLTLSGSSLDNLPSITAQVYIGQIGALEEAIRAIFNQKINEATSAIASSEQALQKKKEEMQSTLNAEIARLQNQAEQRKRELTAGITAAENWLGDRRREVAEIEGKIKNAKDEFDRGTINFINDRFRDMQAVLNWQQGVVNDLDNQLNGQHNWYNNLPHGNIFWGSACKVNQWLGHQAKVKVLEAARGIAWVDLQAKQAILNGIQNEINNAHNTLKQLTDGLMGEQGIVQSLVREGENKLNEAKSVFNSLPSWMFSPEQLAVEAAKHVSTAGINVAQGELNKTKNLFEGIQSLANFISRELTPIRLQEAQFITTLDRMNGMEFKVNVVASILSLNNQWEVKKMEVNIDFKNLNKTATELVTGLLKI